MTRLAVVGAGSVGLAIAWRAATRGARVSVHDPQPGSGASRVAAGMLAAVTETQFGERSLIGFAAASVDAWPGFAAELESASDVRVGHRDAATVLVGLDHGDRAEIDRQAQLYRTTGRAVETLTSRGARDVEPLLSHRVNGGVLVPGDHAVEPRAVHTALLAAAERAGVVFDTGPVRDPAGLDADQVVLAAGCGSAAFGLPIRPVRGAVLRLRASAEWPPPRVTIRGQVHGQPIYLVPRDDGEVVVGATSDERGLDRTTGTAGAAHDLLRHAIDLVPETAEYHLAELAVGFRPTAPDNLPLIGRLDERTVAATGHYRHGIALLPATAESVADLVLGEPSDLPDAFDALRFKENR